MEELCRCWDGLQLGHGMVTAVVEPACLKVETAWRLLAAGGCNTIMDDVGSWI